MTSGDVARTCTDIDEAVLNYAEMKAVASGNPLIKRKMEVDAEVSRLQLLKRNFNANRYKLENDFTTVLPERKERLETLIGKIEKDLELRNSCPLFLDKDNLKEDKLDGVSAFEDDSPFEMKINDVLFTERKKAGEIILDIIKSKSVDGRITYFGEYAGFKIGLTKENGLFTKEIEVRFVVSGSHDYSILANQQSDLGNIIRIQNTVKGIDKTYQDALNRLEEVRAAILSSKEEFEKKFPKEEELAALLKEQGELNEELSMDKKDNEDEEQEVKRVNSKAV